MPSPPRWLLGATSGWQRSIPRLLRKCCASFPRGAKRLGGRAYPSAQPPPRASTRPRPRGGVDGTLSTHRAARMVGSIRSQGASARLRRRLASEVLRDIRTLDRKIADLNERIEAEVEASGTTLTEIFGIGPILAAKIIGTVGNVVRFPTKAHFASYSGTAPVEASSGEVVRHRLSRWPETASSTTLCTWSPSAKPDRTLGAGLTTARRSRRGQIPSARSGRHLSTRRGTSTQGVL
jgi:hypothetical protein